MNNAGAVLLRSDELKELHEQVPVFLSGKELPENCDVRYGYQSLLFVFNEKGEVVHASEVIGGLYASSGSIPERFLKMVQVPLEKNVSLEDCERQYLESKGSEEAYDNLKQKLLQFERNNSMRVVRLLRKNIDTVDDSVRTRFHALMIEIDAVKHQHINKDANDSLASSIEAFLGEHPDHPEIDTLLDSYFRVALRFRFDVSAHCRALGAQWRRNQADANQEATRKLVTKMIQRCDKHITTVRDKLEAVMAKAEADPEFGEFGCYDDVPRLYAQLGEVEQLVAALAKQEEIYAEKLTDGYDFGVMGPIYRDWRKKLRAKHK